MRHFITYQVTHLCKPISAVEQFAVKLHYLETGEYAESLIFQ